MVLPLLACCPGVPPPVKPAVKSLKATCSQDSGSNLRNGFEGSVLVTLVQHVSFSVLANLDKTTVPVNHWQAALQHTHCHA